MSGYCFLLADRGARNFEKTKSDGVFKGCRGLAELVYPERLVPALPGVVESKERRLLNLPMIKNKHIVEQF